MLPVKNPLSLLIRSWSFKTYAILNLNLVILKWYNDAWASWTLIALVNSRIYATNINCREILNVCFMDKSCNLMWFFGLIVSYYFFGAGPLKTRTMTIHQSTKIALCVAFLGCLSFLLGILAENKKVSHKSFHMLRNPL